MTTATASRLVLVLIALVALPACELAEGIFKAGMGVGIFIVLGVIALVVFLLAKVRA
jgi:hypothetical protein